MGGYCKDCGNQHCICDAMKEVIKIYIVQKRLTKYGYEYVDALCFFTEYKKAIEYIKTLPEERNVSYDIEEVESK